MLVRGLGTSFERELNILEQAVYVKAGSILPKLMHNRVQSLLKAQGSNFSLEIYLDET